MVGILQKIFGTKNERELKRLFEFVDEINNLEPSTASLSNEQLQAKTDEFRKRIESGETLDNLLREAFAVVREASRRLLNMRHFDVQLIGGIVLHEGKIAEMKTGEGKTLVATLPVYLNALDGRGVHVVTVNDYLAKRDAQWMGVIYNFLGLSVGVIQHDNSFLFDPTYTSQDKRFNHLRPCTRREAYLADITYGTNNEFGFDYLRDNMKYDPSDFAQRELNYAIVDEVDSILIDEARTPLIISGPSEESTDKYYKVNKIIPNLKTEVDFKIDEKLKNVVLTESGSSKVERLLGVGNLYDPSNIELVHHVLQALRAHHLFKKDVDYVVKDGEVIIVDEFTGRLMPGRRWSDGLHQAIEAKEGVKIESENQTLATITFQNLFRMYNKLAGMTGTADTEAEEFAKIYNLDVVVIPTNRPMIRKDYPDVIYKSEKAKFNAVINDIEECNRRGQPVLVGTTSIEKSEVLSHLLKKRGIRHSVLNAKYHEKEAEIVAQAGRFGAVTIATNMAGRGTDIILGGNPDGLARELLKDKKDYTEEDFKMAFERAKEICEKEKDQVIEAGGLHIIGTERHEARRIDNQLRGRSGRQGDPGSSRFYLSLEDDLMRIFGSDRINGLMNLLKMDENIPIENKMVTKAIENAQKRVEAHNFDIRKHLLEYDDVMNKQRKEIYSFRREVLESDSLKEKIFEMIENEVDELLAMYCPDAGEWDLKGLKDAVYGLFSVDLQIEESSLEDIGNLIISKAKEIYEKKEHEAGYEFMRYIEKMILLQVIDAQWKDHLLAIDHIKEGIGLRGYAQRDPLVEYKKEAFELFADMSRRINTEVLMRLFKVQIRHEDESEIKIKSQQRLVYNRGDGGASQQPVHRDRKVGRNEPCPCGSGKKYKKCCGAS
ncbi:protein translocase subunit SecA [Dissulfurispira thermophila]|uniref:Protein translocase subunit SecA n=1 Tax=Dissulfurispira thermophila TaxID=2715679 RepID=A0A7G1H1F8_9BACT|nr:preprotein translocase subunit SecA [Dissulfurispira thermophila]BCB96645.1 protein translocase subunit SecA [Dissulfurispira thermophila]